MKLYLIRHARTEDSANGLHQSDETPIITEGVDFSIYNDLNPEKMYSSPQVRAKQTAERLFGEYEVLDYIYEVIHPSFLIGKEKKLSQEMWKRVEKDFRNDPDWRYEDGESFNEIKARAKKLMNSLKSQPYKSVAIVSHGIFFRYVLGVRALGESFAPSHVLDLLSFIKWSNLEMKEIDI
jgi:broad specificity phosphatase PhoE